MLATMMLIFRVSLLLLMSGFSIGTVQSYPQIIPEKNEHTVTIGDNYTLTCKSKTPVKWTYPTVISGDITLEPGVNVTSEEKDGYYFSELSIRNVSTLAVGYYFCNETNNDNNYASTYLYVEGGDKLYTGDEEIIITSSKQYSPLVIPCKATSPSVTVKLYEGVGTDNKDEIKLNTTTKDGSHWTYKATGGFTLSNVPHPTLYHHTCAFTNGRITNELIIISEILKVYSFIRQPVIRRWDDTPYNNEQKNLNLTCEVELQRFQTSSFTWKFNGNTLTNDTKYTIVKGLTTFLPTLKVSSNLTVHNISKDADSGNYTCLVNDGDNQNENSLHVDILQITAAGTS